MTILDKLIEKKDLELFIKLRKMELRRIKPMHFNNPKERGKNMLKLMGRKEELDYLNHILSQGKIKEMNKIFWDRNMKKKNANEVKP